MNSKLLGRWGETKAAAYLENKGYSTVGLNYVCRFGEIDIIAKDREYIIFAEVKLRKNDNFAAAREHVTASKQEKIKKAAAMWLAENETSLQPRFDVIEVYAPQGMETQNPIIEHISDAFI